MAFVLRSDVDCKRVFQVFRKINRKALNERKTFLPRCAQRCVVVSGDMNAIEQQVRRLRDAVISGAITREELARRAGLRSTTIATMLDDDWNPVRRTLSALVDVLDSLKIPASPARRRGPDVPS